jgi:hypothetical protein
VVANCGELVFGGAVGIIANCSKLGLVVVVYRYPIWQVEVVGVVLQHLLPDLDMF